MSAAEVTAELEAAMQQCRRTVEWFINGYDEARHQRETGGPTKVDGIISLLARAAAEHPHPDTQRADHYQHLYEQAAAGNCGYSGMAIAECKRNACDCSDFGETQAPPTHRFDSFLGSCVCGWTLPVGAYDDRGAWDAYADHVAEALR